MWSDSINSVVTRMRNYCIFVVCLRSVLSSSVLSRVNTNRISPQRPEQNDCLRVSKQVKYTLKPPLSGPPRSGHLPRPGTFAPSKTLRIYVLELRGYTPRKQQTPVCSVAFTRQCVGVWLQRKESAPASVLKRSSRSLMKSAKVSNRDTPRKSSEFRSLLWRTCGNIVIKSKTTCLLPKHQKNMLSGELLEII